MRNPGPVGTERRTKVGTVGFVRFRIFHSQGPEAMKIGEVMHGWRSDQWPRLGIRAAAKEIGLSPTTLSRIERGEAPDHGTLNTIWGWLTRPSDSAPPGND